MPSISIPAPVNGWDALNSLANMDPASASELINLVPRATSVTTRPGFVEHSNDLGGAVETLVSYHGSTPHLICAEGGALINITAGGNGTNLATGLTNDRWYTEEFKNRLILCNGADAVRDWNGSSLASTSISGATSANLVYPHNFKGRMCYTEVSSQSFWYAAAGAYSGAMTEYDLSQFTTMGGDLLYTCSITRDGGSGTDDYFAAVFDTGEVILFAGDDPGSATAWAMLGKFTIAPPLGRRSATQVGGDVIILTEDGYIPLSAALTEGRYSEQSSFSYQIDRAVKETAQAYSGNYGWQGVHVPELSWFLVNVPISSTQSIQHVRSTKTGAWCKFTGWDAASFCVHGGDLYFGGTDGKVRKVRGTSDGGNFIPFEAVQAYNRLTLPHQNKQVISARPHTSYSRPKYIDVKFFADFNAETLPGYSDPPEAAPSAWNTGEWNTALWNASGAGGAAKKAWRPVSKLGIALAPVVRFSTRAEQVVWYQTDIIFKDAGII